MGQMRSRSYGTSPAHWPGPDHHLAVSRVLPGMRALTVPAAIAAAVIALAGCGGSHASGPLTPVQRCTSAYQAYVNDGLQGMSAKRIRAEGSAHDVSLLDSAQEACNALTPAEAKQAAANITP